MRKLKKNKYYQYLVGYTIQYFDPKVKDPETDEPIIMKAMGRLVKAVKGGICNVDDFLKIEAAIRSYFHRIYVHLTDSYITQYQLICESKDPKLNDDLSELDHYSKEQLLKTINKLNQEKVLDQVDSTIITFAKKFFLQSNKTLNIQKK